MGLYRTLSFLGFVSFLALGAPAARADEPSGRVLEETLILNDPTVSASHQWVIGGALELTYNSTSYQALTAVDFEHVPESYSYVKPGFNLFVGFDDYSLNFTYRSENSPSSVTHTPTLLFPVTFNESFNYEVTETEFTFRYLGRGLSNAWFTPYAYVGVFSRQIVQNETVDPNAGITFAGTGTNTSPNNTTNLTASDCGLGAIFPFNSHSGMRFDGGALWSILGDNSSFANTYYRLTCTFYYNFGEGLNAQAGGRYESNGLGSYGPTDNDGLYFLVGYSYTGLFSR